MNANRRLTWLLLLGALLACVAWGAGRLHAWNRVFALHPGGVLTLESPIGRVTGRVVGRTVGRVVERVVESAVRSAEAQERLRFRPVPPESVAQFEKRTERVRVVTGSDSDLVEPAIPPEPMAPAEPSIPTTIAGKSGNITRLGSDIRIGADQVVVGDVVALGGDVVVEGHVEGDVASMGGDVYLKSTARVDGDVVCMGGRLNEEPGATVGGQRVSGMGARRHARFRGPLEEEHAASSSAGAFVWLLIALALAWAFTGLGPGRTLAAAETLRREPVVSLGIGAMIFALIIPSIVALCLVVAILCITIIGIPFALAALLGYVLFLCLLWGWGYVVAAVVVGSAVLGRMAASAVAVPATATPGVPVATAVPPAPPSLMKAGLVGALVLGGGHLLGHLMRQVGFGPIHALGALLSVLSFIAGGVAVTIGAGAWLRTEIKAGTVARWWRGTQWGSRGAATSAHAPVAPIPHAPVSGSTPIPGAPGPAPSPSAGVWTGSTPPPSSTPPSGAPPYTPPPYTPPPSSTGYTPPPSSSGYTPPGTTPPEPPAPPPVDPIV